MVANLKDVLFAVVAQTKIQHATLIRFPESKLTFMRSIPRSFNQRNLKWTYSDAWTSNDVSSHMPQLRESIVSSKGYLINKESISFNGTSGKF